MRCAWLGFYSSLRTRVGISAFSLNSPIIMMCITTQNGNYLPIAERQCTVSCLVRVQSINLVANSKPTSKTLA